MRGKYIVTLYSLALISPDHWLQDLGKDTLMVIALYIIFGTIGGIIAILVVAFLILSYLHGKRQDLAQNWEAEYGLRQVQRASQKFSILSKIGAPECPDGTYGPLQLILWKQYNALDLVDQKSTLRERNAIVELRGYS